MGSGYPPFPLVHVVDDGVQGKVLMRWQNKVELKLTTSGAILLAVVLLVVC